MYGFSHTRTDLLTWSQHDLFVVALSSRPSQFPSLSPLTCSVCKRLSPEMRNCQPVCHKVHFPLCVTLSSSSSSSPSPAPPPAPLLPSCFSLQCPLCMAIFFSSEIILCTACYPRLLLLLSSFTACSHQAPPTTTRKLAGHPFNTGSQLGDGGGLPH